MQKIKKDKNQVVLKKKYNKRENIELLLLSLPAIIKVFVFTIIPFIWIVIAFQFYVPRKGLLGSPFVGLENILFLFKSSIATKLITNAATFSFLFIIFGTIFALITGLFLFEISNKIFVKMSQSTILLPYFISWPLAGVLLSAFIDTNGMITNLLDKYLGQKINFYASPEYWRLILTFSTVWKSAGFTSIIYYAVLLNVDKSLYESASIDGAGRFKRMFYISLPALKLMIVLSIISSSANILRVDFSLIYYMTKNSSPLFDKTDVIETYIFRAMRHNNDFSVGTAIGIVQGIVGLVLTILLNQLAKKVTKLSMF